MYNSQSYIHPFLVITLVDPALQTQFGLIFFFILSVTAYTLNTCGTLLKKQESLTYRTTEITRMKMTIVLWSDSRYHTIGNQFVTVRNLHN